MGDRWVEKYGVGGESAHENAVSVARGRSAQVQNPAAYLMKYLARCGSRGEATGRRVRGVRCALVGNWDATVLRVRCSLWCDEDYGS